MAKECRGQAGLFVPISGATHLLQTALRESVTKLSASGGIPSPVKDVAVTPLRTDPMNLVLTLDQDQATGVIGLAVDRFMMDLAVHVTQQAADQFSTIRLLFTELSLAVDAHNARLRLTLTSVRGEGTVVSSPGRDALLDKLAWTPEQVETLQRFENYLAFGGRGIVAQLFLDALAFPPILESFVGLRFAGPLLLSVEHDQELGPGLLIRAADGTALQRPKCTIAGSAPEFDVIFKEGGTATAFEFDFRKHARVNPPAGRPPQQPDSLDSRFGIYAYLPKPVLDVSFGPAAFPAIHVSGGGGFGPAQYHWSLWIALKQLSLTIGQAAPELIVNAPLVFDGTVSAWMNLPCDGRLDLGSARLTGDVDPLAIAIGILFDLRTRNIVFDGDLRQCSVGRITASVNTPLGWPLGAIIAQVIRHNAPGMIWTAIHGAVDQMRFDLATLSAVEQQIPFRFDTTLYHGQADSLVFGLAARG
jgi:hypothetical protein